MSVTISYSFGTVRNSSAVGTGQKNVDVVSTGSGFAINSTDTTFSDLDIYDGDGDPIGLTIGTSAGINPSLARFANGNLVTVAQQNGNLFYEINSGQGNYVTSGNFGTANSSEADVAVLKNFFVLAPQNFVTVFRHDAGSQSYLTVDIRNANGGLVSAFDIDNNIADDDDIYRYVDNNAHVVALPPSVNGGVAGPGGFAVLFDRFTRAEPDLEFGTPSLVYAVYNANGSVRKAPTELFSAYNDPRDVEADIVAYGSGFAVTWVDLVTGDLKLRVLDINGNTSPHGDTTTILAAGQDVLGKPTITTLSNGYFGIAVETTDKTSQVHSNTLVMATYDGTAGISQLSSGETAAGDLFNMDSAGFGTGRMVVAGDATASGSSQARSFIVEGVRTATGDGGNDTIAGDDLHDRLNGKGGNDTLSGASNHDDLYGGDGNDTLDGGTGNDVMQGEAGNDRFIVDAIGDRVTELANAGYDTVDTSLAIYTLGANLERVNFTGSASIVGVGNALDNRFQSGAGDDRFVDVSGGADTFSGGTGDDAVDFRSSTTGTAINLATGVHAGAAAGDFYASIEKFYGSNTAADTMKAGSGKANFSGYGGADTLIGGNYADKLLGGADADRLYGGNAIDTLQGGDGNDTLNGGKDADIFLFIEPKFGADAITDFQDGTDTLKFYHTVADSAADFTITGNGSNHVTVTLAADPTNRIVIDGYGGAAVTIDSHDFTFY